MNFPDSYSRPGYIYATAPLKMGVIEKEEMLAWMLVAASMKSGGADSSFICLFTPSLLLYVYKKATAGNAPGTMRYWMALKIGGLYKTPYIGFIFKQMSNASAEMWKKGGSLIPSTYRNHFEP